MLRPCSIVGCGHPAERANRSCMICAQHFCANHLTDGTHTCPTSEDDDLDKYYDAYNAAKTRHLKALLDKVNVAALESAASSARNGITCRIPALADNDSEAARIELVSRQCGGQNCHVDVEFAGGVTWIARIRLDDPLLPPHPVQTRILLSEVATLRFLARTRVPAPQVHAYALEGLGNSVGTSHLPDLVAESESRNGPFYLKHYDDKGDHILVDDDHNITGIIDWEFASFEAKELAFSSPCMMRPVRKFYQGSNELTEEEQHFAAIFDERGRKDLSNIVHQGRRWQRYLFFLGGGIPRDMSEFEHLFQGLRESFANGRDGKAVPDISGYQNWKRDVIEEFCIEDSQLEARLQAESVKDSNATS
ncbi:hypothetical protein MFIFM68171_02075 [Madurella fahalii]|uniref:Aminoglycoside phosphotransferase domain-containing protein n=1 Tax=Madurella fahalii TaxID=1157608 RepID=A0ABQ0G2T2_9PEZI